MYGVRAYLYLFLPLFASERLHLLISTDSAQSQQAVM